jgi:hypothetical protein
MENLNEAAIYTSYDQVPWCRRRWFIVLSVLIFVPVAIVIAFTGDIYMMQKGQVKAFPKSQKWVLLAIGVILILWNISQMG